MDGGDHTSEPLLDALLRHLNLSTETLSDLEAFLDALSCAITPDGSKAGVIISG